MVIQKYCGKRMTGNVISARSVIREKKLKRLAIKSQSNTTKKSK